ncbi:MAG: hypothetical protein ABIE68_04725 [bacterium]
MTIQKITGQSLLHALGVALYIFLIAQIMFSMESVMGKIDDSWGFMIMVMIFTVSAAITGSLVVFRPVYLYMEGQKKEGVQFLLYTIGWLFLITLITLIILAVLA